MEFYLAPMEAVTGFVYRNVYQSLYGDVDKYFAPFITPTQKKILKTRERKDVASENNVGMYMVPQILTNQSEQFIDACGFLAERGYKEFNLNAGCPAATVVTKGKGSGLLRDTYVLNRLLEEIFTWKDSLSKEEQFEISIKTRLGMEYAEEFEEVLAVYNQYPLKEIILHPRVRSAFYKGKPDLDAFDYACRNSKHTLCYNGDIFTVEDYKAVTERFTQVEKVMLGRGLVANPGLVREIRTGQRTTVEELHTYHDALYDGYLKDLGAEKDVLFKMKELWFYMAELFQEKDKVLKSVQKIKEPKDYKEMVKGIWRKFH